MAERFAQVLRGRPFGVGIDEIPLAGELYSVERLEQYAPLLAATHKVRAGSVPGRKLLLRLKENEQVLVDAYKNLAEAIRRDRTISPAAEWLVDNFHIVEEQLREIREDLPESYYNELPKLSEGELTSYPRIYAVALEIISHTDSRLDPETLERFLRAYQRETPLSIGELWAVAITLRLALVENLRRLAARTVGARRQRAKANALADDLLRQHASQPDHLLALVRNRFRGELDPTFVVQFSQRLHDQDPTVSAALRWIDSQLALKGQTTEQVIQLEYQRQAASQVTVANIIASMRLLSTLDWRRFFESVSLIDSLLAADPAGEYARMDFATRDQYRHVIERLSRRTGVAELEIGQRVLDLARRENQPDTRSEAATHVGYYLIDDGLPQLERAVAFRASLREQTARLMHRHPTIGYLGTITVATSTIVALLTFYATFTGATTLVMAVVALLSVIPASDLATSFTNWLVTLCVKPRPLPKMDTSCISETNRTIVVIPSMLTDENCVSELIGKLEVHYLANQDEHIFFALLTDFADAARENMSDDEILLNMTRAGIADLNARYPGHGGLSRFHLFHRRRQWNPSEGRWIGWERKRGKLREFNRLIRGARDTSFAVVTAAPSMLSEIRYVITLDSDTQLPHATAGRLIGTISHPLNRPYFDSEVGRVTRGYGILQPRISISLVSASRSLFAKIFSGNTGVDPYTTAVSDVYQDLFGEGSYTGKGIYDVDAFEAALIGRVADNSLLSHDLFEGIYARAALVTDIELFDDYPERYDTYARRQHRWARGDWQVAQLRFRLGPTEDARTVLNSLPLISRWKIVDNLRRSLVAPAVVLWLIAAWTIFPGAPLFWTLFTLLTFAFPVYAHITRELLSHRRSVPWTIQIRGIWSEARSNTLQVVGNITFTAHQAYMMSDAVVRTLFRKLISKRRLLEWVTAREGCSMAADRKTFLRFMWPGVAIAAVIATLILLLKTERILVAAPFLVAWVLSPFVAYSLSRTLSVKPKRLGMGDTKVARLIARRTWRFFERFVGEEDHWLPPDNYQEDPHPVIAHRTSPTNIGLLLLSTIAAHDFGYTGSLELIERLELTFTTLEKLPRFRGHFFNWYDTHTLEPLIPQYVSTVDSGNLAGHLIVIKQACNELPELPIFTRVSAGLSDTINLISQELDLLAASRQRTDVVTVKQLSQEIDACVGLITQEEPQSLTAWSSFLTKLAKRMATIQDVLNALEHEHGVENFVELRFWMDAFVHQLEVRRRDLQTLTPWADVLTETVSVATGHPEDLSKRFGKIRDDLDLVPVPSKIPELCDQMLVQLAALRPEAEKSLLPVADRAQLLDYLNSLTNSLERAAEASNSLLARANSLARLCERLVDEVDFGFLFDDKLKVLTIGYNVSDSRREESFYDLLASEARLASFIAIATGDVPQEHWFRLGRQLASVNGSQVLISWSATMFEYLMPLLIMRNYENTLLGQTCRAVVARQITYGNEHAVPWGVSESAYNARDLDLTYQYAPFGIPGMGFKRGLSENLVVSPYATLLAALLEPRLSLQNLVRLEQEGALAAFGFYEALDYTPDRLPPNQKMVLIRAFMTHHQGMSLVALDNLIHDCVMQNRFHSDALVQANELLLQERVPRRVPSVHPRAEEALSSKTARTLSPSATSRRYITADVPSPRIQLLSNGTYSTMVTTAGAGYSRCGPVAVTRWREDPTRDNWGTFFYLRDVGSGAVWSAGYQPTLREPQSYEVSFSEHKVDIQRSDVGLLTHMEVIISPEDNAELRSISITNQSSRVREVEVTSYAEVVLAPPASDAAHPAFNNLFIETQFIAADNALLAHRRPRSVNEELIWGVHTVVTEGDVVGVLQYETDRSRFVGRGHSVVDPSAIVDGRPLSNSSGAVLDPIFSLRQRILLRPQETARVYFAMAVAHTREEALNLADKYHDLGTFEREARLAWTRSRVEMRHLGVDFEEAQLFQQLAGLVFYLDQSIRPRPHVLALNSKTQSSLWPYGISGDLPIILVRINDARDLRIVKQLLRGHRYLRSKGLCSDLVILNEHPVSYAQSLQDQLLQLLQKSGEQHLVDKPGGVYLRRTDIMPEADRILLHTVARVCIVAEQGSLVEHLSRQTIERALPAPFIPNRPAYADLAPTVPTDHLSFFNGVGGFSENGSEYVMVLGEGQWTPAPWVNVIANSTDFGFHVSETGASCTWSVNSHENRLTPWSNDAVADTSGEVIYLRDEDTGVIWTPTPLPIREANPYVIRHGQGYTSFAHTSHGIAQELLMFVPIETPVKIARLRLHNKTDRKRRLSLTSYTELVLGTQRDLSAPFIITEVDQLTGATLARNPYNNEFAHRVTFAEMSEPERTLTCDRKEFIGRNGTTARPAAFHRTRLSGAVGAGLDPCIALQTILELGPGEQREIVVLLGQAEDLTEARVIVTRYRQIAAVREAFEKVLSHWNETLTTIEVRTPDATMDVMMNRWLLYQALSCRIWARSAFYQSSGAYGFRDQLQDVMALIYTKPEIVREHILRAAVHQFPEGDVQHWWHPPTGRGVRTRFSDDLLWLPYVTNFYIEVTSDRTVLDEKISFIEAPVLAADEMESFSQPSLSPKSATLFEHCALALDHSLVVGLHGLPLMGTGDWNDAMNRVGCEGKGESVWLGWFLYKVLEQFLEFCDARGETDRARTYREHIRRLKTALEQEGWDGDWYVRGFFDDGTPLGSARNDECRIDSIAQSWGIISRGADLERAKLAMAAVDQHLILREQGLVLLLTPPFDKSVVDPGYIKGYVPGVRENGGQYTQAAFWTLIAFAMLGDGDRAGDLFSLLNPINQASSRAGLHRYKVEPYVVAADLYAAAHHTGRGGWTWYTGAAAWMYRAGLESILGFKLRGDRLTVEPCIPRSWPGYEVTYRRGTTRYSIKVENSHSVSVGVVSVELDGALLPLNEIPLHADGTRHEIRIVLGNRVAPEDEALKVEFTTADVVEV